MIVSDNEDNGENNDGVDDDNDSKNSIVILIGQRNMFTLRTNSACNLRGNYILTRPVPKITT